MAVNKNQAVIVREKPESRLRSENFSTSMHDSSTEPGPLVNSVLKKLWRDPEYRRWRDARRNAAHSPQAADAKRQR